MRKITLLLLLFMFLFPVSVQAQDVPYVFDTTIPVDATLRANVDAWLANSAPSAAAYYAITYVEPQNEYTIVCLAAFETPATNWTLLDDNGMNAVWIGTVSVYADGSVNLLTEPEGQANTPHNASHAFSGAGGGTDIMFPWKPGMTMMYGPSGVHNAGFTTYGTGMSAVDFVGGDDLGNTIAPPAAYASADGTVDYVCTDGTTDAIRVNSASNNKFIYAHLLDNATLTMSHAFTQGSVIGSLKYGTFTDDCGHAEQASNHYHLHFAFVPSNNSFRVGTCILSTVTTAWTCGSNIYKVNGFLSNAGGGGISSGSGEGTLTTNNPTFFDYFLVGVLNIVDRGIVKTMPEHTTVSTLPRVLLNSIRFVLKTTYVLLRANFNMGPAMAALFVALGLRLLTGTIWLVAVILRTIKMIPFL